MTLQDKDCPEVVSKFYPALNGPVSITTRMYKEICSELNSLEIPVVYRRKDIGHTIKSSVVPGKDCVRHKAIITNERYIGLVKHMMEQGLEEFMTTLKLEDMDFEVLRSGITVVKFGHIRFVSIIPERQHDKYRKTRTYKRF